MRIALCGTSCAGKSTLAKAYADKHNLHYIEETAAQVIKKRKTFSGQLAIASMLSYEMECYDDWIADRSLFDCFSYNRQFAINRKLTDLIYDMAVMWFDNIDLFVFVDEYFPLEDNNVREMDETLQINVFNQLHHIMSVTRAFTPNKVIFVKGTTEQRIEQIEEALCLETKHQL